MTQCHQGWEECDAAVVSCKVQVEPGVRSLCPGEGRCQELHFAWPLSRLCA